MAEIQANNLHTNLTNLYDQDFALWVEETVKLLQAGDFTTIDLANLIEEIECLGKNQRKTVRSFLIRLLEHLLKRCYIQMSDCYRGWEIEIRNFRQNLQLELEDSPSLKNFLLEILPKSYTMALENVRETYPEQYFPDIYPFDHDIDQLLQQKYWQT